MLEFDWYIGIDEVGRGPLAGPVTVCAAAFRERKPRYLAGIKDSKKLSAKKRKKWLERFLIKEKDGEIKFAVSSVSSEKIDEIGIVSAVHLAIENCLAALPCDPAFCNVLLDGGIKAPKEYSYQETMIRGDEKERIIAAASIIAKIDRDALMTEFSKKFPEYGFEKHKGYGTRAHYEAIKKHGQCEIHRKSYLKDLR